MPIVQAYQVELTRSSSSSTAPRTAGAQPAALLPVRSEAKMRGRVNPVEPSFRIARDSRPQRFGS
jgi:hypothetical protein